MDHISRFRCDVDDRSNLRTDLSRSDRRKLREFLSPQIASLKTLCRFQGCEIVVDREHANRVAQTLAQQSDAIKQRLQQFFNNDEPELFEVWRLDAIRSSFEA